MPPNPHRLRPLHLILLALILLLAALLRFHEIGHEALSYDELGSMETAAGRGQIHLDLPRNQILSPPPVVTRPVDFAPISNVPALMSSDVHPPLYFILLRVWQDIFGAGDVPSRSLSAIAGVLGVLMLFDIGRHLAGVGAGLWAAAIMAVAQPEILLAHDARPYTLMAFFALAAADALVRIEILGASRRRLVALCVTLIAACLTHYFVLPAIVTLAIYAALRLRGKTRREVALVFLAAGCAVLILWGHGLWLQRKNFADPWMYWFNDDDPHHLRSALIRAATLPMRYLAEPLGAETGANAGAGAYAGAGAAVLYILPWLVCRKNPAVILPALWLTLCVGQVAYLDVARHTNQLLWIKYTLLAGPAVYLLLATLLQIPRLKYALAAIAVFYCVMALPQTYQFGKGGFKNAAADLERLAAPSDPIVFCSAEWGDWYTGGLYMGIERYLHPMPESVLLLKGPLSPELSARLAGHRCWLVLASSNLPPQEFVPGWTCRRIDMYPDCATLFEMTPAANSPTTLTVP